MRDEGQRQHEAIIAAGHAQIEADRKQRAASLRQDVGRLATDLAGRIVGESLEDSARQSRVVDRFLDELERRAHPEQANRGACDERSEPGVARRGPRVPRRADRRPVGRRGALADDLGAVAALLDAKVSLRRVLTDPSRPGETKASLVAELLGGKVGARRVELVTGVVRPAGRSRATWPTRSRSWRTADLAVAERAGALDEVEDELFRFGRIAAAARAARRAGHRIPATALRPRCSLAARRAVPIPSQSGWSSRLVTAAART